MNDKRIVLIVLGAALLAFAVGIPVAINAARHSGDANGDVRAQPPSPAAENPLVMTEEDESIAKASRETGFSAEAIRNALEATRNSSARPANHAEAMILHWRHWNMSDNRKRARSRLRQPVSRWTISMRDQLS